jgi:hypothetical protein
MEEGEKKPDAGIISGGSQKKIVYAVLAIAVVILAVVLVAKFGYNTDLLNPAGGQMSLVQRNLSYKVTPQFQQTTIPRYQLCPLGTSGCGGRCVDLSTDNGNCGSCGRSCNSTGFCNRAACYYPEGDPLCAGVVCQSDTVCCAGRCVRKDDLSSYSCIAG